MPDESITNLTPPETTPASVETPAAIATPVSAKATTDKPAEVAAPIVAPVETPAPPVTPTLEPVTPPTPATPPAAPTPPNPLLCTGGGTDVRSLLSKAMAKIQFRKQAKLEKVMVLAKAQGSITNDSVQKLLRVSDATASRYLAQLVKAGRLRMIGHPRNASYQPIP